MAILSFRKDLIGLYISTEGYEDERGDYIPGLTQFSSFIECDAEPNGRGVQRTFEDGVTRSYSYTVHLNPNCPEFTFGDKVRIRLKDGHEFDAEVLGFHRYQLKAKLWV